MFTKDDVVLPEIKWEPTSACSPRYGHRVDLVVLHTWGVRFTTQQQEAVTYEGVINYFKDRGHKASAHFVFPGSAKLGEITQMVSYSDYAWAEAAYNPSAVEVECADEIWQGHDPQGMLQLSRITAFLLHKFGLPPVWSHKRGFCRHGDLGSAGGGHTACPTTNMTEFRNFVTQVQYQYHRGHFRPIWGR